MNGSLDLLLRSQADGSLVVLLVGPGLQATFSVPQPPRLEAHYQAWLDRFVAHHDQSRPQIPAHVLQHYSDRLIKAMRQWLEEPEWSPLTQALQSHPALPLRLDVDPSLPQLSRLPWEGLLPERSIWRIQQSQAAQRHSRSSQARQPRLLLLVGDEHSLDLTAEIDRLEALHRSGRIALTVLRGEGCSSSAIRQQLVQRQGWDALIFLGHSEADSSSGGRLHLGDGSWLAAQSLDQDLQQAATNGLQLVLLNSCSGSNWADHALQCGVDWAVSFREVVPSVAAASAFKQILLALEAGDDLVAAVEQTRTQLVQGSNSSTALLLSLTGNSAAGPFRLPLRKRRLFRLRLERSSRAQAVAVAAFALLGVVSDVVPWNPIQQGLLNQRLRLQRDYRILTGQFGPRTDALPVLLLEKRRAYPELGVMVPPETQRISREALRQVLLRVPPERVPRVGLDTVLDEPAVEPEATKQLAALIAAQQRPMLFAGYFGSASDGPQAGAYSKPVPVLAQAGLKAYDLAVNTDPGWWSSEKQRQVPLQLKASIHKGFFADALAGGADIRLPVDAVIDWSLNWGAMLRRISPEQLAELEGPVLLVGTDGQITPEQPDLFDPPAAAVAALEHWQLSINAMPGAMVQGVLAQSLTMGHWLMPASALMTTLLAAGLGVLIAAYRELRRPRLWLVLVICLAWTLIGYQLMISAAVLIPLVLPMAALATVALIRKD